MESTGYLAKRAALQSVYLYKSPFLAKSVPEDPCCSQKLFSSPYDAEVLKVHLMLPVSRAE